MAPFSLSPLSGSLSSSVDVSFSLPSLLLLLFPVLATNAILYEEFDRGLPSMDGAAESSLPVVVAMVVSNWPNKTISSGKT